MGTITYTRPAKCKDCKFAQKYRPMKTDGTLSGKTKTKCANHESPMAFSDIRQNDLVCIKWGI